jgi:hypothetical protein
MKPLNKGKARKLRMKFLYWGWNSVVIDKNFFVKEEVPVSEDETRMLRTSLYIDDEIPMLKTYVKSYVRYKKTR